MNTFEWSKIDLKNKRGGQVKLDCPACDHKKTKSLSVNIDKGVAKCHYCEAIFPTGTHERGSLLT